jgi:spore coat polysaccharide biosynthesis predicted glycosyltransferase SpsG
MNVLLVCHCSSEIGLGHLTRLLVIAKLVKEDFNFNVDFLIQGEALERHDLKYFDCEFLALKQDLSQHIKEKLSKKKYKFLILDLHKDFISQSITSTLTFAKENLIKIIGVDNFFEFQDYADIVYLPAFLNVNFVKPENKEKIVYGWNSFLINSSDKPVSKKCPNSIFVYTGGSDSFQLGEKWPKLLDQNLPKLFTVHWIHGPYAIDPILPLDANIKFILHRDKENLSSLMGSCTYALCIYGVGFYEALFHNLAIVAYSPYGEKDKIELTELEKLNLALVGSSPEDSVIKLASLVCDNKKKNDLIKSTQNMMPISKMHCFSNVIRSLID